MARSLRSPHFAQPARNVRATPTVCAALEPTARTADKSSNGLPAAVEALRSHPRARGGRARAHEGQDQEGGRAARDRDRARARECRAAPAHRADVRGRPSGCPMRGRATGSRSRAWSERGSSIRRSACCARPRAASAASAPSGSSSPTPSSSAAARSTRSTRCWRAAGGSARGATGSEAIKLLLRARKLAPTHFEANFDLAGLLARSGARAPAARILAELAARARGSELRRTRRRQLVLSPTPGALWRFLRSLGREALIPGPT